MRVALLALPLLVVPWLTPPGEYTDHLRHANAARVFLAHGPAVFTRPFAEFGYWTNVPYPYPPGALVLFLPFREPRVLLTLTTLFAVLAWAALLAVPKRNLAVAAFGFLLLVRAGLAGFYDPAWVALGLAAIVALERKAFAAALWLCVAAAFVHLRAVVLLPVAVMAARQLTWKHPAVLTGLGVAALDAFIWANQVPYAELYRGGMAALYTQPIPLLVSLGLSALAAGVFLRKGHRLAAACVGAVFLLAVVDSRAWWHASVVLVPLAFARDPITTAVLVLWAVQLQRFAWGGRAWDLLLDAAAAVGRLGSGGG